MMRMSRRFVHVVLGLASMPAGRRTMFGAVAIIDGKEEGEDEHLGSAARFEFDGCVWSRGVPAELEQSGIRIEGGVSFVRRRRHQ